MAGALAGTIAALATVSEEFPTLAAVSERWHKVERDMRGYMPGLDDEAVEHVVTYVNTRGQPWTYPLWRMISHLLMHQSYHRGQVTTLLRQLGAEPVKVDLLDAYDMGFRA